MLKLKKFYSKSLSLSKILDFSRCIVCLKIIYKFKDDIQVHASNAAIHILSFIKEVISYCEVFMKNVSNFLYQLQTRV